MGTTNPLNINDSGLIDFNSSTGVFTSTDLTTKGDLLGYTGSAHQRFAVGTDGYVLKADDTQSVGWRWACAGYEYISSASASSSTSIEFTDFQDSDCYNAYKVVYHDVRIDSGTFNYSLQVSIDNGLSWLNSGYSYCRNSIRDDTNDEVFPYSASDTYWQLQAAVSASSYFYGFTGEFFLFSSPDPVNNLNQGFVTSSSLTIKSNASLTSRGWGLHTTSSPINGLKFYFDSTVMISGEFYLYGMLK